MSIIHLDDLKQQKRRRVRSRVISVITTVIMAAAGSTVSWLKARNENKATYSVTQQALKAIQDENEKLVQAILEHERIERERDAHPTIKIQLPPPPAPPKRVRLPAFEIAVEGKPVSYETWTSEDIEEVETKYPKKWYPDFQKDQ